MSSVAWWACALGLCAAVCSHSLASPTTRQQAHEGRHVAWSKRGRMSQRPRPVDTVQQHTAATQRGSLQDEQQQQEPPVKWPSRALQQLGRDVYVGERWPWQLNGLTLYFATPEQAGSASISGDAKFELFRDGTAKLGGGAAVSTSYARSRTGPGTDPKYDRPFVATQAYVTIPRLLGWTAFPAISYNLAEGQGSVASGSQGYMVVGELAYNGLSNTFGVSLAQGQSSSLNLPIARPGSGLVAGEGFSGIEQVSGANSLTLLTDPRTNQFAQGVAYPFNILTPFNPLTCTQTMITSAVSTWGDLSGPVRPTPRNQPLFLVPFCTEFFNPQVLDNFHLFLQDYLDYYYGYQDAYYNDYDDLTDEARSTDADASPDGSSPAQTRTTQRSCTPTATAGAAANATIGAGNNTLSGVNATCMGPATFLAGVSKVQPPTSELSILPVSILPPPSNNADAPPSHNLPDDPVQNPSRASTANDTVDSSSTDGLYRTASVRVAGFGSMPGTLASAGAQPASPDDVEAAAAAAEAAEARSKSQQPGFGANSTRFTSDATNPSDGTQQAPSPAIAPNVNSTAAVNASQPIVSVARSPFQLFPAGLRSDPTPRPEDINALVKLGQVVTQQLADLPTGKLVKGSAQVGADVAASALAQTAAEANGLFKDAWNLTNQVALLGAKTLLNTFMSSAQAVLPLTQLIYNNSNAWYQAAAEASNKRVDQRIAELSANQEQLANQAAAAASTVQAVSTQLASSIVSGYNKAARVQQTAGASPTPDAMDQPASLANAGMLDAPGSDAAMPQRWNPAVRR